MVWVAGKMCVAGVQHALILLGWCEAKFHMQSMGFLEEAYWIYVLAHTKLAMLGSNSLNTKAVCGEMEEYSQQKSKGILLICEIVV